MSKMKTRLVGVVLGLVGLAAAAPQLQELAGMDPIPRTLAQMRDLALRLADKGLDVRGEQAELAELRAERRED